MRNKTLLRVVEVLGFFLIILAVPAANALQVTLSIPDCPSGQTLSFNSSTNTLSCGGTIAPPANTPGDCSITGNTTTPSAGITAGALIALTANCNTGLTPVSYMWTIPGFGSVGPQASLSTSPTQTTTYTVTATNSAGSSSPFSTTVYVGSSNTQQNPVPANCTVSQSPNTNSAAVQPNTSVQLSVTCGTGSPLTSCAWSGGLGNACTVSVSAPSVNTSYTVTPSNANGPGGTISTTVNVVSPPPVGQNYTNYCSGNDSIININWPAAGQTRPSTNGFGNQRIAYRITVPATFSPPLNINHLGFVRIAEVPGTSVTGRDVTVSRNSCDFQSGDYYANGIGSGDNAPGFNYTVNNPTGFYAVGATFNVNSGDVFYVNIRNAVNGNPSCPSSSCDILFDFATPNRY